MSGEDTQVEIEAGLSRQVKVIKGRLCVSSAIMSEWAEVSVPTLANWASLGCPKEAYGWWYAPDVFRWRGETSGSEGEASVKVKKLQVEQQRIAAKAAQEEIRLQEMQGLYLRREVVTEDLRRVFLSIKRALLTLGRQVGIEVATVNPDLASVAESVAANVTRQCLEQLSVAGKYRPSKG